jgi:hypothetical protein
MLWRADDSATVTGFADNSLPQSSDGRLDGRAGTEQTDARRHIPVPNKDQKRSNPVSY